MSEKIRMQALCNIRENEVLSETQNTCVFMTGQKR